MPGNPTPDQNTSDSDDAMTIKFLKAELEYTHGIQRKMQDRIVALAQDAKSPTATLSSSPAGRYQFVGRGQPQNQHGLLLDTTTGHCWLLHGDQWTDIGSPTTPPAKSLPQPADSPPLDLKPVLPDSSEVKPQTGFGDRFRKRDVREPFDYSPAKPAGSPSTR